MRRSTELTNQIITSKKADEILNMVADVYGNDYVSLWLFEVIGRKLDTCDKWIDEYIKQLVPQTATWSLPYWEDEYGLSPGGYTEKQRRQNILNKMWSNGPMNPAKLGNMITGMIGFDTRIVERTGKRKFTVMITANPSLVNETVVTNVVSKHKPSHLIFDVKYERGSLTNVTVGGVVQKFKVINLKEV